MMGVDCGGRSAVIRVRGIQIELGENKYPWV